MKNKKLIANLIVICLYVSGVNAQTHDKISLKEKPVAISTVKNITGFYGQRMKLNRNIYLKNFPIDQYVDFIIKREHSTWNWEKAEQHGKWIESAYLSAIQTDDKELMAKADAVLNRILDSSCTRNIPQLLGSQRRDCLYYICLCFCNLERIKTE